MMGVMGRECGRGEGKEERLVSMWAAGEVSVTDCYEWKCGSVEGAGVRSGGRKVVRFGGGGAGV